MTLPWFVIDLFVALNYWWLLVIWTLKIWTVITNPNPDPNPKPNTNPNPNLYPNPNHFDRPDIAGEFHCPDSDCPDIVRMPLLVYPCQ